jgi:hypothetical protein
LCCPVAALVLGLLTGCEDSTGPDNTNQTAESLSVTQFGTRVANIARIEVAFTSLAGLVAREIKVEPDDAEEKIVSRVIDIDPNAGTLTLELGTLVVNYDASTRFRTPVNGNAFRATWESAIIADLEDGLRPSIEARRTPLSTPQAPNIGAFFAADLRITQVIAEAKIEVYVDADNFAEVPSPPPLAILTVFGRPVEITRSTRLERIVNGTP